MNTRRGSVSFEVGGASYSARLSTNAMIKYQDEAGENVIDAFNSMESGSVDMKRLRNLLWVSIDGDHSKDDVGDIMDDMGFERVGELLNDVVRAAFPDVDEKAAESGNGKKKKARAT